MMTRKFGVFLFLILWVAGVAGCSKKEKRDVVVVYTALDQIYSEPILQEFTKQTGIKVESVYDAESVKTVGLANRLLKRRKNPDCDVFWNNEILQTQRLAREGVLARYESPQAKRFDARFRDPNGFWTGFAARARVIIYNTDLLSAADAPRRLEDLLDPKWKGRCAIARPFFGTTSTHFALLHQQWGAERLREFCRGIHRNDVALCLGNATVRDRVVEGRSAWGLTDTDDAHAAMLDGKPVAVTFPDQPGGIMVIPNTVALIRGAPHEEAGKKLIDFLLSPYVEKRLAAARSAQIPLADDLSELSTPWSKEIGAKKPVAMDLAAMAKNFKSTLILLQDEKMDE